MPPDINALRPGEVRLGDLPAYWYFTTRDGVVYRTAPVGQPGMTECYELLPGGGEDDNSTDCYRGLSVTPFDVPALLRERAAYGALADALAEDDHFRSGVEYGAGREREAAVTTLRGMGGDAAAGSRGGGDAGELVGKAVATWLCSAASRLQARGPLVPPLPAEEDNARLRRALAACHDALLERSMTHPGSCACTVCGARAVALKALGLPAPGG